jgi:hypothetical protein
VYIEIELSMVPPTAVLREADDFTSFKIVAREAEHARVPIESLERLAGDRAEDPEWRRGFTKMLEYAQQHGWVDDGAVRAHIEWPASGGT